MVQSCTVRSRGGAGRLSMVERVGGGDGMNARERCERRSDGGAERTERHTGEGRGKHVAVEAAQFTIVSGYLTSSTV